MGIEKKRGLEWGSNRDNNMKVKEIPSMLLENLPSRSN